MNDKVIGLFPEPVMITSIERDFTEEEKKYVESCSRNLMKNHLNYSSQEVHVLEHPAMKSINKFILDNVVEFIEYTEDPIYDHKYFITTSWFNYTNPGQGHHEHDHKNSYVSGVLYLSANRNTDKIIFSNPKKRFLEVETKKYGEYNSKDWEFKVGSGDLVIFRSYLSHRVPQTNRFDSHTRISLSFNTFLKGNIGDPYRCSDLEKR